MSRVLVFMRADTTEERVARQGGRYVSVLRLRGRLDFSPFGELTAGEIRRFYLLKRWPDADDHQKAESDKEL